MNDVHLRFNQVLSILEKEYVLLKGVHQRLFESVDLTVDYLNDFLNTPVGIDRFESFTSKFCRMQDSFVDKLVPLFLATNGELSSTAINNLNRLEQLNIINNANDWFEMRLLRNKLVHEYVDDTEDLLVVLNQASKMTDELFYSYLALKAFSTPPSKRH